MIPHFRATSRRGLSGFEKMRLRGAGPRRFVRRRRKRAERGREGRKCVVGGVSAADEAGGRLRSQFFLVPSTRRLPRERSARGARGSRRDRESRTESRRHRCRRRRCFSDRSSPASLTGAKTIWSRDHVLRLPRPYLLSPLHSPFPVSKCFFFTTRTQSHSQGVLTRTGFQHGGGGAPGVPLSLGVLCLFPLLSSRGGSEIQESPTRVNRTACGGLNWRARPSPGRPMLR